MAVSGHRSYARNLFNRYVQNSAKNMPTASAPGPAMNTKQGCHGYQ